MLTIQLRGETICRMSRQQLPGNKPANLSGHELQGVLLPVALPLVNSLAFTALIRAFQCYPPRLLSQSLLLAPQSHCSPLYLSHLISSHPFSSLNSYSSVSHSPHLACPCRYLTGAISSLLPCAHQTDMEGDVQTPSLTSPMSTLLSSCPHSGFLSGSISA